MHLLRSSRIGSVPVIPALLLQRSSSSSPVSNRHITTTSSTITTIFQTRSISRAARAAACTFLSFSFASNSYAGRPHRFASTAEPVAFASDYRSMSTFTTSRTGDGTVTVAPKNEGEQSALVVICHGLGDTSEGFADVAEHLATQMPHIKFILPTAPTQPVTMNMGMAMPSWYDIVGLDERSNENCKGIEESRDVVRNILQKEHEGNGLAYNRMVLAGFSQGGALSLYTGMQLEKAEMKLAGILVMSGYLPCAQKFVVTEGLEDTPILHGHGENDPMVLPAMASKSRDYLVEKGVTDYELKTYPGLVHSVSPEEIGDVVEFLSKVLPPDENCKVKLKDPSEMSVKELKAAIRNAGLGSKAVGLMEKSEFVKLLKDHRDGK